MHKFISTTLTLIIAVTFCTLSFAAETNAKRVDINSATEEQLKVLPGVGNEAAKKIVAGRPYYKKDDLKTKNIISADSFEKIKKLIDSVC
ncbi:MAG TPA: helix-hairpin-helix domain-containing protein [Desulfuromonadales bacterium]|nr:helix-hairpin-helix domain-containing protein [Desulfuromonadales bacterium]